MFFKRNNKQEKQNNKKIESEIISKLSTNAASSSKNFLSKLKMYALGTFSAVVLVLIIVLCYKIYTFVSSIEVKEIEIVGASTKVKEELEQKLSPLLGKKITSINLMELKQYLNQFIWFKNVSVYRNLNGKLVLTVLEKNPYFLWLNEEGNYKIIDGLNNIVKRKLNFSLDNLIVIEKGNLALDNSQEIRFLIYSDLQVLKEIKKIVYDGYRWDIILKNGIIIKLPEQDMKLAYLKIISLHKKQGILNKNIEYIDARSINKLFIQPK
jgi:cell division protein FtsQ